VAKVIFKMQSGDQKSILNVNQKKLILLLTGLLITSLFLFRNFFFQPTLLLKSFGELSVEPEIAFSNNKPTFVEFYAEWCEVCKEMAPKVSSVKNEYEKEINFVFLNVDNQKWENYIRKFNVNGIPQVNLFDNEGNLQATFIGRQEEETIKKSLNNLVSNLPIEFKKVSSTSSQIRDNNNQLIYPRSHG